MNKHIIQNIFRSYLPQLKKQRLPLKDLKAIDAITQCQTPEQGYDYLCCPNGHEDKIRSHSCRHRSCPICADKARQNWVEQQQSRLLNCPHYHVVFTLPHEYLILWQYNRKWFTQHFFDACHQVLIELLGDPKYLGALPGIIMALHTWGRQLNYHPHIHCLVTAGGIKASGEWQEKSGTFLLPIRVVKALFRGKMQAKIKAAIASKTLTIPPSENHQSVLKMVATTYKKQWSVNIQDKYEHGKGVILYLARYMKGGPIKPQQIKRCDQKIHFTYKDYRDQKTKVLALEIAEFIRRLLWHVPVVGIHTVRHFGLYASKNQKMRNRCRTVLGGECEPVMIARKTDPNKVNWCCRVCHAVLTPIFSTYKKKQYENSYNESSGNKFVQQYVQADLANVLLV